MATTITHSGVLMLLRLVSLYLCSFFILKLSDAVANNRTLDLFPATVIADIKETGQRTKQIETQLEQVISQLDSLKRQYDEKFCEQSYADADCIAIKNKIEDLYYHQMLDVLDANLPSIKASLEKARRSLEAQLSRNIGGGMSPQALQQLLMNSGAEGPQARSTNRAAAGRPGARLSERFRQYYSLVASSASGSGPNSLTRVAASIYLDMSDALNMIEATQQELYKMRIIFELNEAFGTVTPEMETAVSDVKTLLFGEDLSTSDYKPSPARSTADNRSEGYRSPFER